MSPIELASQLPTLGELLHVLDETQIEGDNQPFGVGHPTRVYNDSDHREELRGFLTITSGLYPQLEALDAARVNAWIAEQP